MNDLIPESESIADDDVIIDDSSECSNCDENINNYQRSSMMSKFENLPEEVLANICSCFLRNSTTNLVDRNLKRQQDFSTNSLFEHEDLHTINIDDLIDIYPLSLLNRTIRNKILNNNHLWNEEMVVDLSDFSKSTKLFKYMNKVNDWNSSDDDLIVAVELERLSIALRFLSCLGLSEYIKKLKVSCILKQVGLKESISFSKLIIDTFPNITDLIYYGITDRNAIKRYETLDCSQSKWKHLNTIRVYFDFTSLLSLLEHHKSTVQSISFAPKLSDKQSTENLLNHSTLLTNVSTINIDMKFELTKLEQQSNMNYFKKFGALIVNCNEPTSAACRITPKFSHLQKIVLERIFNSELELSDLEFVNLSELTIGFEHTQPHSINSIIFKNVSAPKLKELTIINASVNTELIKDPFGKLQSIKFSNCEYDMDYWIGSHPTVKYLSVANSEMRGSTFSFSLNDNQSLLYVSLFSFDTVSIKNINPACKLYFEKCDDIQVHTNKVSEIFIQNLYVPCKISLKGESCTKLSLPKCIEKCIIRLKAISDLSCYYFSDYMKILPYASHNISLDTLYISSFQHPAYLQEFLTSFKRIGVCKCVISSDHTFSKVFYNISPSSTIVSEMSNHEKIITHGDISLLHYLTNCTSLHTLISGSKLICSPNSTYLSNSLIRLEASFDNLSSSKVSLPNLKELIISHSENIDIDLSEYPSLVDFSISNAKNVNIQNTSNIMKNMRFFLLESISTLSININTVDAPNLREAIIHSIKSIRADHVPTFSLANTPKLLFYYVSFVWKPALKAKTNNSLPTESKTVDNQKTTNYCQLL